MRKNKKKLHFMLLIVGLIWKLQENIRFQKSQFEDLKKNFYLKNNNNKQRKKVPNLIQKIHKWSKNYLNG